MSVAIDQQYADVLGANIKAAREQAGFGLRELAREADVSPSFLSEIESGISVPGADKLQRIAKALKKPVTKLLPA